MMFPNAQNGIAKIWLSQILVIVSIGCALLAGLGLLLQSLGLIAAFGIISVILLIIAFIINLVGLVKAQNDDTNFKIALYCTIVTIVLALVSAFLNNSPVAGAIISFISNILTIAVTVFIILGIKTVSEKLENFEMAGKAQRILIIYAVVYGIGIIAMLISNIMKSDLTGLVIAGVIAIVAAILELIAGILYLMLLGKAKEAFKR